MIHKYIIILFACYVYFHCFVYNSLFLCYDILELGYRIFLDFRYTTENLVNYRHWNVNECHQCLHFWREIIRSISLGTSSICNTKERFQNLHLPWFQYLHSVSWRNTSSHLHVTSTCLPIVSGVFFYRNSMNLIARLGLLLENFKHSIMSANNIQINNFNTKESRHFFESDQIRERRKEVGWSFRNMNE